MQFVNYKIYAIIFVIALLTLQILLSVRNNSKLKKYSLVLSSELEAKNCETSKLKNSIRNIYDTQWSIEQKKIIKNTLINNYIKNEDKVLCLIKNNLCRSCILSVVQDLCILGKEIGFNKIILIKDKITGEDNLNLTSYGFKILEVDTLLLPLEDTIVSPLIFIINRDLDIIVPYSSEWYPELYEEYFIKILPSHFR